MDGHGGNGRSDPEFHDFFRQKAHGPPGSPFRCRRTSQGRESGIEGSIESHFGNPRTGLAHQGRLQAFLNKALFQMLDGARGNAEGPGNIGDLPCRAMPLGVASELHGGGNAANPGGYQHPSRLWKRLTNRLTKFSRKPSGGVSTSRKRTRDHSPGNPDECRLKRRSGGSSRIESRSGEWCAIQGSNTQSLQSKIEKIRLGCQYGCLVECFHASEDCHPLERSRSR